MSLVNFEALICQWQLKVFNLMVAVLVSVQDPFFVIIILLMD